MEVTVVSNTIYKATRMNWSAVNEFEFTGKLFGELSLGLYSGVIPFQVSTLGTTNHICFPLQNVKL